MKDGDVVPDLYLFPEREEDQEIRDLETNCDRLRPLPPALDGGV